MGFRIVFEHFIGRRFSKSFVLIEESREREPGTTLSEFGKCEDPLAANELTEC